MKDSTKVFSVTVPGGCHSQGCHGYPQFAQVPSPHPSTGELKNYELITIRESCSGEFLPVLFICYFISVKSKIFRLLVQWTSQESFKHRETQRRSEGWKRH